MHEKYLILTVLILAAGCSQSTIETAPNHLDEVEVDLCNEIQLPQADVQCSNSCDCFVTINGDNRVIYFVDAELNGRLDFRSVQLDAGTTQRIGYCRDSYVYVEVTPMKPVEGSFGGLPCKDRRVRIDVREFE